MRWIIVGASLLVVIIVMVRMGKISHGRVEDLLDGPSWNWLQIGGFFIYVRKWALVVMMKMVGRYRWKTLINWERGGREDFQVEKNRFKRQKADTQKGDTKKHE